MESGDHNGRGRISNLPPLEGDSQRSRHFTAVESKGRGSPTPPPLKSESATLPSLYRRRSMLAHKPIMVTFVRNGDKHFEGVKLNITQRNMRSWENLLAELSRRIDLPAGVRNIYTPDGGSRIKSLSQLEHQKIYVCGSTEPFKRINYNNLKNPDWKVTKAKVSDADIASVFTLPPPLESSLDSSARSFGYLDSSATNWMESRPGNKRTSKIRRVSEKPKSIRLISIDPQQSFSIKSPEDPFNQSKQSLNFSTQASQHKVLMIYRNAPLGKRECVKVYLNKNVIKSWEEAKQLISENLNTINGILRLFDLEGNEIDSLSRLWAAGGHLVAAGKEKFSLDAFLRGVQENEELSEIQPENSTSRPSVGWSMPVNVQTQNITHSSPKKNIFQGRPLPVIRETATSSNAEGPPPKSDDDFHSEYVSSPRSVQIDKADVLGSGEDTEVVTKSLPAEVPSTTGPEALGKDTQIEPEQVDKGDESQNNSKASECYQEVKEVQFSEPAVSSTIHTQNHNSTNPTSVNSLKEGPTAQNLLKETIQDNDIASSSIRETLPDNDPTMNSMRESMHENNPVLNSMREPIQETDLHSSDGDHNIISETTPMAEDKPGISTSSSDVSLPNRRDSLYVHHHFPPSPSSVELGTPEFGSPTFKARRRRKRRMSLLQELQNDALSRMSTSSSVMDLQLSPQKPLPPGQDIIPRTPFSEVSLGVPHTVVDMLLPAKDDQSMCSTIVGTPTRVARASRSIAIQTSYVDDELHTTMEAEIMEEQESTREMEPAAMHRKSTEMSFDVSAIAALLYRKARDKYKVGMVIEEGAFAAVKSCKSKEDDRVYLARVIQKGKVFGRDDKILQEIKIMRMLRNDNLMCVVDYWESSNEYCMVMEPIEGGDLYDAILYCQHFSEQDSRSCAHQLGLAMVYLHANMIVHRNIKPENIFLSLEPNGMWTLKLAGFSLATIATEPLSLECGNEYYRAPEITSGRGYGAKADVWSAGIITYILLSGVMPFSKKTRKKTKSLLSFPTVYWENISSEAKDFVQHLLKTSPNERYSSSQLLQHPWFKMPAQSPSDTRLSEMLVKYLAEQATMKIAPVLILTETALSHDQRHGQSHKKHRSSHQNDEERNKK